MSDELDIDNIYYWLDKRIPKFKPRYFCPHIVKSYSAKYIWYNEKGKLYRTKRMFFGSNEDNEPHDLVAFAHNTKSLLTNQNTISKEDTDLLPLLNAILKNIDIVKTTRMRNFYGLAMFKEYPIEYTLKQRSEIEAITKSIFFATLFFCSDFWEKVLGKKSNEILRRYFRDELARILDPFEDLYNLYRDKDINEEDLKKIYIQVNGDLDKFEEFYYAYLNLKFENFFNYEYYWIQENVKLFNILRGTKNKSVVVDEEKSKSKVLLFKTKKDFENSKHFNNLDLVKNHPDCNYAIWVGKGWNSASSGYKYNPGIDSTFLDTDGVHLSYYNPNIDDEQIKLEKDYQKNLDENRRLNKLDRERARELNSKKKRKH